MEGNEIIQQIVSVHDGATPFLGEDPSGEVKVVARQPRAVQDFIDS